MAPQKASTGSKKEPTLFEVLSLTPNSLEGQDTTTQTKTVKQAYRRALLKHHPDKNQQAKAQNAPADPQDASSSKSSQKEESHFTVDQITHAYTVLSDNRQRREYSRSLRTHTRTTHTSSSTNTTSASSRAKSDNGKETAQETYTANFQTGVETVDLDDLDWDAKRQVYHRSCRCGSTRGYCFRELDLEEVGEEGELMVQCVGCSLWLRVLFTEAAGSDEEDDDGQDGEGREVRPSKPDDKVAKKDGSAEGKKSGWSWKINFGISIGGGVSGGAKAGRGS
jgi:diphthamide biosynthesis protein 4